MSETTTELRRKLLRTYRDEYPDTMDENNDLTRRLIAAFKEEYGSAWLGWINLYDETRGGPVMWEWDGGMVCNFGASFVSPKFDQEIVDLILTRDRATYTGTKEDYERIKVIFDRMQAIGGVHLFWR